MVDLNFGLIGKAFLKALITTIIVGLATISPLLIGSVVSSFSNVSSNGEFFIYGISLLSGTFTFLKYKKSSYSEIFHDLYNVLLVIVIIFLVLGYVGTLVESNSHLIKLINDYSIVASCIAAILYFISQVRLNYKILNLEHKKLKIDETAAERDADIRDLENRVEW